MEWLYALIGLAVGYFLRYFQTMNFSPQKLKFRLEMLSWRFKFFFKHRVGKFW